MLFRRLTFLLCAFFALPALAADADFGLVTGSKTGTYYAVGKDIAQAAAKVRIIVEPKASEGSIDNIRRINSAEKAALGIVQSDVLGFLARSRNPDSLRMASNLRLVFPLYNEEVHVLAQKSIKDFAGLKGKRVAVGQEGSGSMLTAINLFSMMNVEPAETLKIPAEQGVVAVLKGELDAVVVVAGKPVRLFKNLENLALPQNQQFSDMLARVHFLALDNPKMLEEYRPASITKSDYGFVKDNVETVAVQAVLVSYDFADGNKKRCEKLGQLAKTLREQLAILKEKGHPKWQEVNLDADTGIWKKDTCAWPQLAGKNDAGNLSSDLVGVIGKK